MSLCGNGLQQLIPWAEQIFELEDFFLGLEIKKSHNRQGQVGGGAQ